MLSRLQVWRRRLAVVLLRFAVVLLRPAGCGGGVPPSDVPPGVPPAAWDVPPGVPPSDVPSVVPPAASYVPRGVPPAASCVPRGVSPAAWDVPYHTKGTLKPRSCERNIAIGEVRNTHVTHSKYDINVRTAQRWRENSRR